MPMVFSLLPRSCFNRSTADVGILVDDIFVSANPEGVNLPAALAVDQRPSIISVQVSRSVVAGNHESKGVGATLAGKFDGDVRIHN